MFSRIQTIFLFLVAIFMFSTLLFPIFSKKGADKRSTAEMNAFTLTYQKPNEKPQTIPVFYIAILAVGAGAVSLYSVLRYRRQDKDTKTALYHQIRFNMLTSMLIVATVCVMVYFKLQADKWSAGSTNASFGIGFFCPTVALLCNSLASRFIRKDYNLIKGMDRLR